MKKPCTDFISGFRKFCFLLPVLFLFSITVLHAQRPASSVGIGFQAGNPTGLSLQFYKEHGISTDILLAYNFNNFYFVNVHGLWNTHLDDRGMFHLFYGPGGFVGVYKNKPEVVDDVVTAGISGDFGLNMVVSRVEFFGQVTPRLELINATRFNWGGGAGIRLFF